MRLLVLMSCIVVLVGCSSASRRSAPTPATPDQIEQAIDRGVAFLVGHQNKDGSWGSPRRTKELNIYSPVPGAHLAYRTACTALCISGMIEAGGLSPDELASLERGEQWLMDNISRVRRPATPAILNSWGHAYGIQALVRMYDRIPDDQPRRDRIKELLIEQVGRMAKHEALDGGWNYYDFNAQTQKNSGSASSFTTATGLVALWEAHEAGIIGERRVVDRAIASVRRQQKPDYSYLYGESHKYSPMYSINRPAGSLGRSQACNIALRYWGAKDITNEVVKIWLQRLIDRNEWLSMIRKRPVPHEGWFAIAGYFYYYAHYYAALNIEVLPKEEQGHFQEMIAGILIPLQEADGSWWDYPMYEYHYAWGTGFALQTLSRCRPHTETANERELIFY
jgi:hypothetical protein